MKSFNCIVAIGGGHGLGRMMSALSEYGKNLTGIVTTTDNGGSTGRIREAQGGIAWGDARNCINQLVTQPSVASRMFEYRFAGSGELSGHNLGNLMLKALDNLSIRPLEAINLVRELLKIEAQLIPMTEQPADLTAIDIHGHYIHGEVNVDKLADLPERLMVTPEVSPTSEAIEAIIHADFIVIGPGSFFTSLFPPLLLPKIQTALVDGNAPIIFVENLSPECSSAGRLTLEEKLLMLKEILQQREIDAVIVGDHLPIYPEKIGKTLVIQQALAANDVTYRHDRIALKQAIEYTFSQLS